MYTVATAEGGQPQLPCSYPLCGIGSPALLRHLSCFSGAISLATTFWPSCHVPWQLLLFTRTPGHPGKPLLSTFPLSDLLHHLCKSPSLISCYRSVYLLLLAWLVTLQPSALPWPSNLCPLSRIGEGQSLQSHSQLLFILTTVWSPCHDQLVPAWSGCCHLFCPSLWLQSHFPVHPCSIFYFLVPQDLCPSYILR